MCEACELLNELNDLNLDSTNYRFYWLLTELFMELHNGYDYCEG